MNFAEVHAGESLKKHLESWIPKSSASASTLRQWNEHYKRLIKLDLLTDKTTVRETPDVLRRLRARFEGQRKAVIFNHFRSMFLTFLQRELGYDEDSQILKHSRRIKTISITHRREHHPLETPIDLAELGARINTHGRWDRLAVDYESWIWFMSLHGLRPEEFANGLWHRDVKTGHIRINGTKTKNAVRVVPSIAWYKPEPRSLRNLQMRLYFLDPPTPVRARDFRRTAAIWWEASGIPRSRYRYYMGHGEAEMTDRYQIRTPTESMLNEDKHKLETWILGQVNNPKEKVPRVWVPGTHNFLAKLLSDVKK
jgi:hypothetical protein